MPINETAPRRSADRRARGGAAPRAATRDHCARARAPRRDRRARRRAARARRRRALGARAQRPAARAAARRLRRPAASARALAPRRPRVGAGGAAAARRAARRARAAVPGEPRAGRASTRNVVVIHDAAPLRHPGWYSRAYAALQRRLLPLIARRALHVITVSEFSRGELRELLGVERVSVVRGRRRPGVLARRGRRPRAGRRSASRARTCSASPRTPRARTSRRSRRRPARSRPTGSRSRSPAGTGRSSPPSAAWTTLRLLGHVPDELLPGLYAGAEAFALPSLYEGFGLPVLEAMAAGTPVVAADAAALPETCGGAARLVPPDGEAFRDALVDAAARRRRARAPARGRPAAGGAASAGTRRRAPSTRCWTGSAACSARAARGGSARSAPACRPRSRCRAPPQPRPVERVRARPRESHVYQTTRSIRSALRSRASSRSTGAEVARLAGVGDLEARAVALADLAARRRPGQLRHPDRHRAGRRSAPSRRAPAARAAARRPVGA